MKICSHCKKSKENEEFSWRYTSKGIRQGTCKNCMTRFLKNHYLNNAGVYAAKQRERNKNKRQYTLDYKDTHPCVICGESEKYCLEFHHINPKEKLFGIGIVDNKKLEDVKAEMKKCVILCANCHRKYHAGIVQIPENVLKDKNI